MDDEENEFLSKEEIDAILEQQKDYVHQSTVALLIDQNADLLNQMYNLQEFMEDNGLSHEDYKNFLKRKRERTYH